MTKPATPVTITKSMLATRISERHFEGHTMHRAALDAIKTLLEVITDQLSENNIVLLKNHGKLIPRIKEGGRIVRNVKTKEESTMGTIATVTMPRSIPKSLNCGRVPTSMIQELLHTRILDADLAKATVTELLAALIETQDGTHRIEFRGFGVFSSRWVEGGIRRNPKNGDRAFKEGSFRPHFKVSDQLQDILLEKLPREE